jgi:hypothetical protein
LKRGAVVTRSILIENRCAGCDSGAHNHCWITVSNMREWNSIALLNYSDMDCVFIPIGPSPLSSAPALAPRFALPTDLNLYLCPAESPPRAHLGLRMDWIGLDN